jgi:hypothetical protein
LGEKRSNRGNPDGPRIPSRRTASGRAPGPILYAIGRIGPPLPSKAPGILSGSGGFLSLGQIRSLVGFRAGGVTVGLLDVARSRFSERVGARSLRESLQVGEMDRDLRFAIWNYTSCSQTRARVLRPG